MQVTFEMDDDTFDLIMVKALSDHIRYCYTDVYFNEKDVEWNEKLKQAMWVVFDYFAGEEKVKELKTLIEAEYENQTVRSAE
jgi:hypothetical protein